MQSEIVFDVETQKSFAEIGSRNNFGELGVSVLGAYLYSSGSYEAFREHELPKFEELLRGARRVIGFNIKHFDYPVIQPHMPSLAVAKLPTLDLMEEVARELGFRPKLNDLAKATLGVAKSGHGLEALRLYKEGRLEELTRYCLDDVRITKDLYEFGAKNGYLMVEMGTTRTAQKFPVSWKKLEPELQTQYSLFT